MTVLRHAKEILGVNNAHQYPGSSIQGPEPVSRVQYPGSRTSIRSLEPVSGAYNQLQEPRTSYRSQLQEPVTGASYRSQFQEPSPSSNEELCGSAVQRGVLLRAGTAASTVGCTLGDTLPF